MTNKELFCSVLRAALFPQAYPMPPIPREQYGVLHELLDSHALTLLPAEVLRQADMPEPDYNFRRDYPHRTACTPVQIPGLSYP